MRRFQSLLDALAVQTITDIRNLLAAHGLKPKHRLGQNFLHDHNQIRRLIRAADVRAGECVLEVGPGTGTLTEELLASGANVIACEVDSEMCEVLRANPNVGRHASFRLIEGDALQGHRELNHKVLAAIGNSQFKLVANLPYQVASPLMTSLLIDHASQCVGQFVTIQKEVADRLAARPSTAQYGPLSIIAQTFGSIDHIGTLSAACFWPQPKVVSAMVALHPRTNHAFDDDDDRRAFARFVVEVFGRRRKQIGTILGRGLPAWKSLANSKITPDVRAEQLTGEQFALLWRSFGHAD